MKSFCAKCENELRPVTLPNGWQGVSCRCTDQARLAALEADLERVTAELEAVRPPPGSITMPLARWEERQRTLMDELERVTKERDEAVRAKEFSAEWYAVRFERLGQLARERGIREMFSIMANGTATAHEPPTYAQLLATTRHRVTKAESERDEALSWAGAAGAVATRAMEAQDKAESERDAAVGALEKCIEALEGVREFGADEDETSAVRVALAAARSALPGKVGA